MVLAFLNVLGSRFHFFKTVYDQSIHCCSAIREHFIVGFYILPLRVLPDGYVTQLILVLCYFKELRVLLT